MVFKRNGNKKLKDKEYFLEYIRGLSYGEFLSLIEAMFQITKETSDVMSGKGILKEIKKRKNNEDPSIG